MLDALHSFLHFALLGDEVVLFELPLCAVFLVFKHHLVLTLLRILALVLVLIDLLLVDLLLPLHLAVHIADLSVSLLSDFIHFS